MDRLRTLAIFQRVSESRSFTQAAASLNLPRSTVTQAIQRLEGQIQTQLLLRTTRQVSLTNEGELFLAKARQLLAEWDELENLFGLTESVGGLLRIDLPSRLARLVVVPALSDFHQRYPDIQLHLSISDRPIDLVKEGVDAVLRAGELQDSSLIAKRLGKMPLVTLASPAYLAQFGTPQHPKALDGQQMVGYALPSSGRIEALEFKINGKYEEVMLAHPLVTNGADAYMAAALAGFGLVQAPLYDVKAQIQNGQLTEVLADFPPNAMPLAILYPQKRHHSSRVKHFVDWLAALLQASKVVI